MCAVRSENIKKLAMSDLNARYQAAQQATVAAEEKIQKLIQLVKKARDEEETVRLF
jgi:hypothetical protein